MSLEDTIKNFVIETIIEKYLYYLVFGVLALFALIIAFVLIWILSKGKKDK